MISSDQLSYTAKRVFMVIEFLCQYCKAMIRVPDSARGGKGRCPKCAIRINVPKKSVLPPPTTPVPDEDPVVLLVADDDTAADDVIEFAEATPETEPSAPFLLDEKARAESRLGSLPIEAPTRPNSTVQRRKQKKQTGSGQMIGVAVVAITAALGGAYYYSLLQNEKLTGEVVAKTAESLDLPASIIRKSQFDLPPEVVEDLLHKLELNPVPLNSQMMRIELRGTTKGLAVSLAAGDQSQFYRVDLNELESVRKFLVQHRITLEEERFANVTHAATQFLETYSQVLAKQSATDSVTVYRDSMALPSLVGGLGYQLVAQHSRTLYRCVYQDQEGGCYFLLPRGITEFRIIGRTQSDGQIKVPAQFDVHVQGTIPPLVEPQDDASKKAMPNAEKDETRHPPEQTAPKLK